MKPNAKDLPANKFGAIFYLLILMITKRKGKEQNKKGKEVKDRKKKLNVVEVECVYPSLQN